MGQTARLQPVIHCRIDSSLYAAERRRSNKKRRLKVAFQKK